MIANKTKINRGQVLNLLKTQEMSNAIRKADGTASNCRTTALSSKRRLFHFFCAAATGSHGLPFKPTCQSIRSAPYVAVCAPGCGANAIILR